jgi:TrfA protein
VGEPREPSQPYRAARAAWAGKTDELEQTLKDLHEIAPESAQAIRRMERLAAERVGQGGVPAVARSDERPIQLPMWPEPVRGGPNPLLRSALFAAIHSKKRKELGERIESGKPKIGVTVAAQDGVRITFAGDQLNQYDADVFYEGLHRARLHPLETECFFKGYSFLKAIGRAVGTREYEDLHDSLTRLRDGRVVIEWTLNRRDFIFTGGLISSYIREKNSKRYKVTFAKEIRDLFAPACWTQLEWQERVALKGHPLAQWLHSYFSTHANPFPVSLAFLHEKTGSARTGQTALKNFRTDLKNALATLENKLGWKAIWNGDLVTVRRPISAAQARHLAHKSKTTHKQKSKPQEKGLTPLGDFWLSTPYD